MRLLLIFLSIGLFCDDSTAGGPNDKPRPDADPRVAFAVMLVEKVSADKVSVDSAWEVYSAILEEAPKRETMLSFIGNLSNFQLSRPERTGYLVRPSGPFIRDLSEVLSIRRVTLLEKFSTEPPSDKNEKVVAIFDAHELFLALGTKELGRLVNKEPEPGLPVERNAVNPPKPMAEQPGAGQPATKPADTVPAKDQPSTPTSKDAPR